MTLEGRRLLRAAAIAGALLFALCLMGIDAAARRRRLHGAEVTRARRAVVRLAGAPDLALSSSSRWLRHPSQVEITAAVQDGPASLDVDPAGLVLGPPLPPRRPRWCRARWERPADDGAQDGRGGVP
jgi:hypothetical protein